MLTVRIEHARRDMPEHSVVTCAAYDVDRIAGGVRLLLDVGTDTERVVDVASPGKAFVMNDQGVTIDVIKTNRKARR